MNDILLTILAALVTTIMAFAVGMLYGGIVRKLTARVQNRVGPPIWQNFIDLLKLEFKTTNIHHGLMSHLGPVWIITAAVTTLMFIPILHGGMLLPGFSIENLTFKGDLIFLIYMMCW